MSIGSSLKAIVLGCVADIVGTFLIAPFCQTIFMITIFCVLRSVTVSDATVREPMLVVNTIAGSFATVVGGYLTARLAPSRQILHAAGMGLLSILSALLLFVLWPKLLAGAWWYNAVGLSLTLPCALAGGFIYTTASNAKSLRRTRQ